MAAPGGFEALVAITLDGLNGSATERQ